LRFYFAVVDIKREAYMADDRPASMTMRVQEIVCLGKEFGDKSVRVCTIDGEKYACVLDVIEGVTGNRSTANTVWTRIKAKDSDLLQECKLHMFGSEYVVANAHTIMKIIFALPRNQTKRFVDGAISSFLHVLNPTSEFGSEICARIDELELAGTDDQEEGILIATTKSRTYASCNIYVRIRVPAEHMVKATGPKQMSMKNIKFGIAFTLNDRDTGYNSKDPDNGFFAFSFQCRSRGEAVIVENFMKLEYAAIRIPRALEYLDASRLADALGVEYDGESYEAYVNVARKLFVHMVEKLKHSFPGQYEHKYGDMHSVRGVVQEDGATTFVCPCDEITRELAIQFGFRNPTTTWKAVGETAPPKTGRPKSNGAVISCHLVTGEEQQWSSVELGARTLHLEPKNVRSSVDSPRQCGGYVWRTSGAKKWVVPGGLIVDPTKHDGVLAYIKGVDSTGQIVFENKAVAARLLNLAYNSIDNAVGTNKCVGERVWSFLTESESSAFVDEVDTSSPRATFMNGPDNGANGRTHGRIVVRDISTGVETSYESKNDAATMLGLRGEQIGERLDKPMRALGLVFRRFDATERWEPPSIFKFRTTDEKGKPIKFENRSSPDSYVVSMDDTGNVTGLYENKVAAAQLTGISRSSINNLTDTPQTVKGMKWRSAVPEDYMTFVPCEPPRIV
jgi:hypothetical protein